jgi:hypothetical protein
VDPIVLIILIVVGTPTAVIWALSKSASLRGPAPRPVESRKPVDLLVTDVIPEEHPEEDEHEPASLRIDSAAPEPADAQRDER